MYVGWSKYGTKMDEKRHFINQKKSFLAKTIDQGWISISEISKDLGRKHEFCG